MTKLDLPRLRAHEPESYDGSSRILGPRLCEACGQPWPCDARRVMDAAAAVLALYDWADSWKKPDGSLVSPWPEINALRTLLEGTNE
jgi:hypothetical protein